MIVLGSGEFASNFFLDFLGNKDLVLNVVAWLGQDPSAVGVRTLRQRPGINQLYVSEAQGVRIYRIAVLAQPAMVLRSEEHTISYAVFCLVCRSDRKSVV